MDTLLHQMSEKEREEIIRYGIKRGVDIFISTLITIIKTITKHIVCNAIPSSPPHFIILMPKSEVKTVINDIT